MRIDSLLNDHTGVVAPHHSANPGSLEQHRPAHTTAIIKDPFTNRHSGAISSSAVLPASSSDPPPPPSSSLQNHYSPYQQGTNLYREHTAPSRVTYSGPPACSLAAAVTGSPEPSIPRHSKKNTTWFEGKTGIMHSNTGSTFPGREQHQQQKQVSNLSPQFLPPFTDFVSNMQQPTSTVGVATESAVSPRPSHRQQHLSNHQAGYSSYPAQYQQKSYYQQKYLPPAVNDGSTDNLMRFADVACMESATLGGRRCLDDVAAAEVLSGRQGSMVAEGSDNSLVRITASVNIEYVLAYLPSTSW